MDRRRSLTRALVALLALTAAGTAGYVLISRMSFLDALYMTVITLSTVGYKEVQPLTLPGRLFTMALIVAGLGVVLHVATTFAAEIIEGSLQKTLGRRHMQHRIGQLNDHVIVCGFGRMGASVCNELRAKPVPFVVIDRNPEVIEKCRQEGYLCVEADLTTEEERALEEAGIARASGLIAALPSPADNVYLVLTARELRPDLPIVARAEDQASERKLLRAGATRVVSPYVIGGHRMAHALLRPGVLEVIDLATHYRSMELQLEELTVFPGGYAEGETLQESGLREKLGVIVIAVRRPDGEVVFKPGPEYRIGAGDHLVVLGEAPALRELERQFRGA